MVKQDHQSSPRSQGDIPCLKVLTIESHDCLSGIARIYLKTMHVTGSTLGPFFSISY
jgi:hypothetical protein